MRRGDNSADQRVGEGRRTDSVSKGENPPDVASDAKLASPSSIQEDGAQAEVRRGQLLCVAGDLGSRRLCLFGLVLFQLMPEFSKEAVDNVEHYGASFGLGRAGIFWRADRGVDRVRHGGGIVHRDFDVFRCGMRRCITRRLSWARW